MKNKKFYIALLFVISIVGLVLFEFNFSLLDNDLQVNEINNNSLTVNKSSSKVGTKKRNSSVQPDKEISNYRSKERLSNEQISELMAYNPAFESVKNNLYPNRKFNSFAEYFENDTNISNWASKTEARLYKLYSSSDFKQNYNDYPIHSISCKDTLCQLSFVPIKGGGLTKIARFFTKVPDSHEYDHLRSIHEMNQDGSISIYILRRMQKPEDATRN